MLGRRGKGEGGGCCQLGCGTWEGKAAIMMCGCDGKWYSGDGSLKSLSAGIHAIVLSRLLLARRT